ncbi:phytanoyl-CoA dioxygenase family protein [Myxococcota bacterium]|nr:phytanoyl-CoA dioxygenase family protein [Myxococcota bacterium]
MSVESPTLSSTFELSERDIDAYRRDGHVTVRGLARPDEIEYFRPSLLGAGDRLRHDRRPLEERDTYGRAFVQVFNLWRDNGTAQAFVHSRRFARVAAELMGVSGVRLYHDQALFKEPGGGATPWHQDQFYWPLDTSNTITLWIPLVPVIPEMGTMTFASGSQRFGSLGEFAIGDESNARFANVIEDREFACTRSVAFDLGDASFHSGWTLHSAPPNRTKTLREVMTVIYYADGARVSALDHPNRQFDRDMWLRGCEPGELAAGKLNPCLYHNE